MPESERTLKRKGKDLERDAKKCRQLQSLGFSIQPRTSTTSTAVVNQSITPNNPGFNDPLARIDDPTLHCVHIEITELKSPAPIDNTEIQDSLNDVTFVKSRTPELSTQEGTSQLSNCLANSLQVSNSCGATGSSFYKGFKLDANAIVLKAGTDVLRMYMSKDSGAGRNRMMILCQICKEYEEEAIRWSRNGVVYLANGIRCDSEKKLKEVVDHLLGSSHKAVLEKKKC